MISELYLLASQLKNKSDLAEFARAAISEPARIPELFEIMKTDQGSVKFTCEKVIRLISEQQPMLLYPYFNDLAKLLDSVNNFLKWGAIITISNLISVDSSKKFDAIYEEYFGMILSDSMITSGNVIKNAWKFIQVNPAWESDITGRMLATADHTYLHKGEPSPECGKIIAGGVIDCFAEYFPVSTRKDEMLQFAAAQRNSTRKQVAKKASAFVKKYGASRSV